MKKLYPLFVVTVTFLCIFAQTARATTYEYKCAPTNVKIERTSTSSPYKYTLTISQNTQWKSSTSSTISTKEETTTIVLTTSSQTLEGTYNNSSLAGTKYHDLSNGDATLNTSQNSSFQIVRNEDGSYSIKNGTIYTKHKNGDQRIFDYCYSSVSNTSATKGDYTFFPNWGNRYTMSNIKTFNAEYNSATNGYDITFNVTGTNNSTNYNYNVSLFLANASDLLGTFRTGTATNTLSPNSTIVWTSDGTTRYPIEYTTLTISQTAPNQYKLAGKLYALIEPTGTNTPYVYDFGNGQNFEFLAEQYTFNEDGTGNPSLQEIANKRLRFDLTLNRSLSVSHYNTFCSPVTIPAGEIETLLGDGAEVYEFAGTENEGNNYTFTFSPLEGDIVAGVPYLVKPSSDIEQIELTNVPTNQLTADAQTVTKGGVSFCGILAPYTITELDPTLLFLADNDQLKWGAAGTMKGMRAYFRVNSNAANISTRIQIEKRYPTDQPQYMADQTPCTNGKYIRDGQLIIMHNGKKYGMY